MAASERPHGAHGPAGRSPHTLRAAEARLRRNPYPALRTISCGYRQGVLTLRGRLASDQLKRLAQQAVAEVEGVERIQNLIEVVAPPVWEDTLGLFTGGGSTLAGTAQAPARRASDAPDVPTGTRRVLVVGDHREVAERWALAIGHAGHRVRHAWYNPGALALAEEFQPDAVVLDIGLAGNDRLRVARQLREIPGLETVLLVALTEPGTEGDRQRADAAGFDYYLTKPVDVAVLQELLTGPGEPPDAA
jgi:CheY-like chemotaxis protein